MSNTFYKVWLQVEEINLDEDKYENVGEPDYLKREFPSFETAIAALDHAVTSFNPPKWSVLLGYPDYLDTAETYYAWVEAFTVEEAVTIARQNAVEANRDHECKDDDHMSPDDLNVLLVTAGHINAKMRKED